MNVERLREIVKEMRELYNPNVEARCYADWWPEDNIEPWTVGNMLNQFASEIENALDKTSAV